MLGDMVAEGSHRWMIILFFNLSFKGTKEVVMEEE